MAQVAETAAAAEAAKDAKAAKDAQFYRDLLSALRRPPSTKISRIANVEKVERIAKVKKVERIANVEKVLETVFAVKGHTVSNKEFDRIMDRVKFLVDSNEFCPVKSISAYLVGLEDKLFNQEKINTLAQYLAVYCLHNEKVGDSDSDDSN